MRPVRWSLPALTLIPALILALGAASLAAGPDGPGGPPPASGGPGQDGGSGPSRSQDPRNLLDELRTVAPEVYKRHAIQIAGELADLAGNATLSADSQKYADLSYRFATSINAVAPSSCTVRGEPAPTPRKDAGERRGGRRGSSGPGF